MAATITLKSGVTIQWGIPTAHLQAALGTVKSIKIASSMKEKEYPGEGGETAAFVQYDAKDVLDVEIIALSTATIPAAGTVFTHATVKYLILGVNKNWQNEDAQSFTLTCRTFANIALT